MLDGDLADPVHKIIEDGAVTEASLEKLQGEFDLLIDRRIGNARFRECSSRRCVGKNANYVSSEFPPAL